MTDVPSMLAELLTECDTRGIRLKLAGDDGLTIDAPKDSLSPDLLAQLKTHKAELLALLRPARASQGQTTARGADVIPWDHCADPSPPRPACNGLAWWWNPWGERRCVVCDPPTRAIRTLERAEEIRRCHGIPSPAGAAELLAGLKRLTDNTCRGAN